MASRFKHSVEAEIKSGTAEVAKHRSRKDTKRWCGGKEGREHRGRWISAHSVVKSWMTKVCETCGKKLDHCWQIAWSKKLCICGFHDEAKR